mmetsp:Transcript_124883/g.278823  ORF Transcript_124883/g.278823 Transcript_124883/m.278823 type:complete len:261 (-) Transcript_124883:5-787(-)
MKVRAHSKRSCTLRPCAASASYTVSSSSSSSLSSSFSSGATASAIRSAKVGPPARVSPPPPSIEALLLATAPMLHGVTTPSPQGGATAADRPVAKSATAESDVEAVAGESGRKSASEKSRLPWAAGLPRRRRPGARKLPARLGGGPIVCSSTPSGRTRGQMAFSASSGEKPPQSRSQRPGSREQQDLSTVRKVRERRFSVMLGMACCRCQRLSPLMKKSDRLGMRTRTGKRCSSLSRGRNCKSHALAKLTPPTVPIIEDM